VPADCYASPGGASRSLVGTAVMIVLGVVAPGALLVGRAMGTGASVDFGVDPDVGDE
jgi:hypothetical protein